MKTSTACGILLSVLIATSSCTTVDVKETAVWRDAIPEDFGIQVYCPSNWHVRCTLVDQPDFRKQNVTISPKRLSSSSQFAPVMCGVMICKTDDEKELADFRTTSQAMQTFIDMQGLSLLKMEVAPFEVELPSGQKAMRCQFISWRDVHYDDRTIMLVAVQSNMVAQAVLSAPVEKWDKYSSISTDRYRPFTSGQLAPQSMALLFQSRPRRPDEDSHPVCGAAPAKRVYAGGY